MLLQRTIAYIDGFNLYFGLRSRGWQHLYWLDVKQLMLNLLQPQQVLQSTKYFSARVSGPPDKVKRQTTFLEALQTLTDVELHFGKYHSHVETCPNCQFETIAMTEKMTDVGLATALLEDAFLDRFDVALVVSGDADLVPAIAAVKRNFPSKRVVAVFPPDRRNSEIGGVADAQLFLGQSVLRKSLLPQQVTKPDGYILTCPPEWGGPAALMQATSPAPLAPGP